MKPRKSFVVMLLLVALLAVYMVEFFLFRASVLSVSGVQTGDHIGVYWDEDCSLRVESIDWGVLSPRRLGKLWFTFGMKEMNRSFWF